MNLPNYEFLSAPLWLVTTLHVLTLSLHFVAMNFLFGGLLIVLHAKAWKRWDEPALLKFVRMFPAAMAATVTLGVAPLLFLQMVYHRQVYASTIVSGWFWLCVIPVVIIAYYAIYRAAYLGEKMGKVGTFALFVALAGMSYVSICYSSVFSMAERPGLIKTLYAQNQTGLMWNPEVGDYLLRWLHMMLGALTVGGFFVGLIGRDREEVFVTGKRFFLGGMIAASLAGLAYLLSLQPYLKAFMHSAGIWALTVAVVLSLGSMHFFFKKKFLGAGLMLFVSLLGMVFTRHEVRLIKLSGQFDPSALRVAPQWSPFVLFLVCFVLALAIVAYMLRLVFNARTAAGSNGAGTPRLQKV